MALITRQEQVGFTLIELVIIIVILSITVAIMSPRFFSNAAYDARFFYLDVLNSVRFAEKLAVASGCDVQVNVTGGNTLTLNQRASCITTNAFTANITHPGTGTSTFVIVAPSGVSLSSSANPFYFDRSGQARNSSDAITDVTMTVGAEQVKIEGLTGYVHDPSS